MRAIDRAKARKQIDKRLKNLRNSEGLTRPARGWIRAIREALGMTTTQLGNRLGIKQSSLVGLEKAEASQSITLETLKRAARALDCRLVYALVPRKSLEELAYERARAIAKKRLRSVSHNMALEDQAVDEDDEKAHLDRLIEELMSKRGSALWEDE